MFRTSLCLLLAAAIGVLALGCGGSNKPAQPPKETQSLPSPPKAGGGGGGNSGAGTGTAQ